MPAFITPPTLGGLQYAVELQRNAPPSLAVTSLTSDMGIATATTATAHGFASADEVTIAGATPVAYNGRVFVTVTSPTQFTYPVGGGPASPATGTITATFAAGAAGRAENWTTLATVRADVTPLSAAERVQAAALASFVQYRVRIPYRADLTTRDRLIWEGRTLEIAGIVPGGFRLRQWLWIDCGERR